MVDSGDFIDRLNESNRIQQAARILPNGKLTDEQIDQVRADFTRYMSASSISALHVARQIDYVPSVVNRFAGATYDGDNEKVARRINDWMERDRRRTTATRTQTHIKTWVAETMRTVTHQACKLNLMAAIVAPAGCGKSLVLKVLADELSGIYTYCDEGLSERELLFKIHAGLGFTGKIMSRTVHRQSIIKLLRGTRRPVLLDEAQNLTRAIRTVRSIFDQAEVPIIMAGTSEILGYIDDRADGRGQFSSRCIRWNVLEQLRSVEGPGGGSHRGGRDLFTEQEIVEFFASKKIRLSMDGLQMLWLLACQPNHGTLRLIDRLASIALDLNPGVEMLGRSHVLEALMLFRGEPEAKYLEKVTDQYARLANVG